MRLKPKPKRIGTLGSDPDCPFCGASKQRTEMCLIEDAFICWDCGAVYSANLINIRTWPPYWINRKGGLWDFGQEAKRAVKEVEVAL